MELPKSKPSELKALFMLHKAMLAGQILFALVAFYLVYTKSFSAGTNYPDRIFQVTAIALSAGGFFIGNKLFNRNLLQARKLETSAREKFLLYRKVIILQWALIQGPCLFTIICFLLTGNYAFLALALFLMLVFAMMAPSKLKILFQLQFSEEELAEL